MVLQIAGDGGIRQVGGHRRRAPGVAVLGIGHQEKHVVATRRVVAVGRRDGR